MIFDATSWSWVGTDQDEADLLALLDSSRSRKTSGDYGHSWSATFNGDSCSSLCTDVVEAELLTLSCNLLRSSDAFDDSDQNSRYTTFSANSSLRIDEELTLSRSLRSSELCDNGEKINSTTVDATWYSSSSTNVEKAELLALHCSSKSREVIDDNDHNNTTQQTGKRLTPVAVRQCEPAETIKGRINRRPSRIPRPVRRQAPTVVRPQDTFKRSQPSMRQSPKRVIRGEVPSVVRLSQNGPNAYTHRPVIAVNRRQLRPVHGSTSNSAAVGLLPVEVLTRGHTAKTASNCSENAARNLPLPPVAPPRAQFAPKDTKTKFEAVKLPSVHRVVSDDAPARRPLRRPTNRDVIELRALGPSMVSGETVRDMYARRAELLRRHGRLPPLKPA